VYNYYYQRGEKKLRRRIASVDAVFGNPCAWPESEVIFEGREEGIYNAGNANAVASGGRHFIALYSGSGRATSVFVVLPVSANERRIEK
jgi:hypothetical protein